jgi:4-amino-4-deoxy-L-arabinose transferase-like glycosyltransferase
MTNPTLSSKMQKLWHWLMRWWWLWLPALGIGLRLAYVLLTGKSELAWGDEVTYDLLAQNVAAGRGYCFVPGQPSLMRAPLYPLILAGLYALFGHHYAVALGVQVLIGGLSAAALVVVGRQLSGTLAASILAGCLFACHPLLIFAAGLLYSETIYLFLLLLFTYSCLKMAEGQGKKGWAVVAGLLLGASVLMKPNLLLFPLAVGLWLWIALRSFRRALWLGALVALATLIVVLPWTWRNYRVSGALVPVSANSGLNLWQGNHPEADGAAYPLAQVDPLPGYSEVEKDGIYRQWAVEEIRAHPGRVLARIPRKLAKFFAPLETSNRGRIPVRLGFLVDWGWAAFLGLALWGAVRAARHFRTWLLIYLLILYPVGLTMVFYGGTRYGMVVYPYLFLLAAEPLVWLAGRLQAVLGTRRANHVAA